MTTVRVGATVFNPADPNAGNLRHVIADTWEAYRLNDGEFLMETYHGYRTVGRLTGRTRKVFGLDCPTIERFEIETYAENGVVLGRKSDKIIGTLAVRPENVETS